LGESRRNRGTRGGGRSKNTERRGAEDHLTPPRRSKRKKKILAPPWKKKKKLSSQVYKGLWGEGCSRGVRENSKRWRKVVGENYRGGQGTVRKKKTENREGGGKGWKFAFWTLRTFQPGREPFVWGVRGVGGEKGRRLHFRRTVGLG